MADAAADGRRTVDDFWRSLAATVYPDYPPLLLIEFRKCFYAGSIASMRMVRDGIEQSRTTGALEARLNALYEELHRFQDACDDEPPCRD